MGVEQIHEERETLAEDFELPGHAPRGAGTALFERTRKALMQRVGARCWVCGRTAEESGHPLEAHHHPVERSFATAWDWPRFIADCKAGEWGAGPKAFDWDGFMRGAAVKHYPAWTDDEGRPQPAVDLLTPADPYLFVDDMTANGRVLCKEHHTAKGPSHHGAPYPFVVWAKYAPQGYQITPTEHVEHDFT